MRGILRVKYCLYINNMSIMIMNGINEIGRKSPSIANKIVSIGGEIKLSISNLSIKVRNTINEFIHPNRYEKKMFFKKKQSVLKFIELPNKDLIPIDKAINALRSCKQDSLLKSKMLLIDYITDMKFKPLMNNVELLEKSNSNYLKESEIEFDDTRYESANFHSYEIIEHGEKESSTLSNLNNDDTPIESNENKLAIEKDKFKSFLIETTKDISLLDRLSDSDNSYGYTFLAKASNFLEDYNGIENKEKSNCFNKKNYLNKLVKSDCFFKLNKKANDIICLQYLKNEQSKHENGVVEEIIIKQPSEEEKLKETEKQKETLAGKDKINERNLALIEKEHKARFNLINNNKLIGGFLDEIDEQLKISNENKHLTLKELLEKVKKS